MKPIVALALFLEVCTLIAHAAPTPESSARAGPTGVGDAVLLDRFLHSDRPVLASYRAHRRLEASTMGGKMQASLEAWTYVDSRGRLGFDVIREDGSEVIRDHVLRRALETEQRNYNERETSQVELTPANYDFRIADGSGDLATIWLLPRRLSPMLLNGAVTVTRSDGDIVRIDGSLSERPSWWTRHVDIVRRYTRINGVRVPIEMSSWADVRVVGDSTFLMTYRYTMINGQSTGS